MTRNPSVSMKPFSNLLNSLSNAYNKVYKERGFVYGLYQKNKIEDEKYLLNVPNYIHNNPVNHGFEINWSGKYCSYLNYLDIFKKNLHH